MSLEGSIVINTSKGFFRDDSARMSLDENVGNITSEAALPVKCSHELRGEHRRLRFSGYFRANAHNIRDTMSVEGSRGGNTSAATSGKNSYNIRDAIERGGEQRREHSKGFFWAYSQATVRGDSNPASKCWGLQRMLNLDTCPCPSGQGGQWSCAHQVTSVSYVAA